MCSQFARRYLGGFFGLLPKVILIAEQDVALLHTQVVLIIAPGAPRRAAIIERRPASVQLRYVVRRVRYCMK
jgi:hypothetical protein